MEVRFINRLSVSKIIAASHLHGVGEDKFLDIDILPVLHIFRYKSLNPDYERYSVAITLSWLIFELKIELTNKVEHFNRKKRIAMRIKLLNELSNEITDLIEEEYEKVRK